jgi:hypothetical protein
MIVGAGSAAFETILALVAHSDNVDVCVAVPRGR